MLPPRIRAYEIVASHGFEESSLTHALVMELVEGDTLADRLTRGPIAVERRP